MTFDTDFAIEAFIVALRATPITLLLAIVPFCVGLIFGVLLSCVRVYKIRIVGFLAQVFVVIVKGIPFVLILLMINTFVSAYFDNFAQTLNLSIRARDINPILIAFLALSITATAAISEAIRGAINSVSSGQFEASYSVGLNRFQTMYRIILPQAFPISIPVLCSLFIGLIKSSSLAFMVAVVDLLNASLNLASRNFRFLEAYVAAALIYWALSVIVERGSYYLEKKYAK